MQVAWKNIFKKKPKLKALTLSEMIDVWKICKPFLGKEFEPYLMAEKIYSISVEKAAKLYQLFYGVPCVYLNDEISTSIAISFGFTRNRFEDFVQIIKR